MYKRDGNPRVFLNCLPWIIGLFALAFIVVLVVHMASILVNQILVCGDSTYEFVGYEISDVYDGYINENGVRIRLVDKFEGIRYGLLELVGCGGLPGYLILNIQPIGQSESILVSAVKQSDGIYQLHRVSR